MTQDPISKTTATYDEIASNYAERWQERGTLAEHMVRFVELMPKRGLVCDVGCGPGFDTEILNQRGFTAIGLDRSWGMMMAGKLQHGIRSPFVQVDMRHLPFGRMAFTGLWICASMLHLPREDVAPTLNKFATILETGGILYLSVKMGDDTRWMPNPYQDDLLRYFTYWQPETLDPLLVQAGFNIIDGWENQGKRDWWLVRFAQKL